LIFRHVIFILNILIYQKILNINFLIYQKILNINILIYHFINNAYSKFKDKSINNDEIEEIFELYKFDLVTEGKKSYTIRKHY